MSSTPQSANVDVDEYPPIQRDDLPSNLANDPRGQLPLIRRVRETQGQTIQYDRKSGRLICWNWPLIDGVRVAPSDIDKYRASHGIRAPGCLCASEFQDPNAFTESTIYVSNHPGITGEYVAACRTHRCKYFVKLERMYSERRHTVQEYLRVELGASGDVITPPPLVAARLRRFGRTTPQSAQSNSSSQSPTVFSGSGSNSKRLRNSDDSSPIPLSKRQRRALSIDPFIIQASTPTTKPRPSGTFALLMLLDSSDGDAGITAQEFKALIRRCNACSLYMTKRVFNDHVCQKVNISTQGNEVIDLTGDDD